VEGSEKLTLKEKSCDYHLAYYIEIIVHSLDVIQVYQSHIIV
jgi:hypothetical protein